MGTTASPGKKRARDEEEERKCRSVGSASDWDQLLETYQKGDATREEIIKRSRDIQKLCKNSIYSSQRCVVYVRVEVTCESRCA